MWFTLVDDLGNRRSFGFAPVDGTVVGPGKVYEDDDSRYIAPPYNYEKPISQEDYETMVSWAEAMRDNAASGNGTWAAYNPIWNSCVDFTWAALSFAGLTNSRTFEGSIYPPGNSWEIENRVMGRDVSPLRDWVNDSVDTFFRTAQRWFPLPRRDPLIFDLDGDGIETVPTTAGVLFDHDGDGIQSGTGWIEADDGFLIMDRNCNGTIDNGTELFGDATDLYTGGKAADGFSALAQEDTNSDGKVSNLDAHWSDLRVWRDLNQNGESEAGELFTLDELDIVSIDVASTAHSHTLPNGNQIADLGSYTKTDGSAGTVAEVADLADVNLATDTFHREFTDQIPLAEGVSALPDMRGSGLLRDLREAMSQSTTLRLIVENFAAGTTKAAQMAVIDGLLRAWADTSGLATSLDGRTDDYKFRYMAFGSVTRAGHVSSSAAEAGDADATSVQLADDVDNPWLDSGYKQLIADWNSKIHTVEAFNGRYFFNLPGQTQDGVSAVAGMTLQSTGKYFDASSGVGSLLVMYSQAQLDLLQQSYEALRDSVYGALVSQTRLQSYLNQADLLLEESDTGISIGISFAPVEAAFQAKAASDAYNAVVDLLDLQKYMGVELRELNWSPYAVLGEILRTATITPDIGALLTAEHVQALGTADTNLTVTDPKGSTVIGNDLGNTLVGISSGSDTLVGLGGNDTLRAAGNNDVLDGGAGDDNLGISGSMLTSGTTYVGGIGNDTITGAAYNDTYFFNVGDGQDTITEYNGNYAAYTDVLRFGSGIAATDVTPERSGEDLVFKLGNGTDQVTVENWFTTASGSYQIERVEFVDGTVWTNAQVTADMLEVFGTAGADSLTGVAAFAETLHGAEGN